MSDSVQLPRRQPTRNPSPWDSPGKNTAVGCHFLLQCMKVKSESEVAQSFPTLSNPMDCSLPGSSIHGIFQARVLEWGAIAFSATQGKAMFNLKKSNNPKSSVPVVSTLEYHLRAQTYSFSPHSPLLSPPKVIFKLEIYLGH